MTIKQFSLLVLCSLFSILVYSQNKYITRTGHINVQSSNRIVDIEADNYQVISTINPQTGDIIFTGLLKSFEFQLGAADQVFNSKAVDVSAHPKMEFTGKIMDKSTINFTRPGRYNLKVSGVLTLWGEKRETSANGTIVVTDNGTLEANSKFVMRLEEASVKRINQIMKQKLPSAISINTETLGVSRNINVQLEMTYQSR